MCGIVGFLDKTGNQRSAVGQAIFTMLNALGCRGPDSAGVALYGPAHHDNLVMRISQGEDGGFATEGQRIASRLQEIGQIRELSTAGAYLRLVLDSDTALAHHSPIREQVAAARRIEKLIYSVAPECEVVSLGHNLEILKQVGSPQQLDDDYCISQFTGTHGLGHTRLSTESRVDLSHSQPFWAHGYPDLATVHNGHITNYNKMRRIYEQRGVKFYTENDSEIIGVYLAERLSQGMDLEEALHASLVDFDGSFSYLAATPDALAFAKDPYALKPLLYTENDTFVAVATEEIAIRATFAGNYEVREAQAKDVHVWRR